MRIAIITSGRLPVPATKGGAVETKIDYILEYNAKHQIFDITTYSIPHGKGIDKSTSNNHYIYYSLSSVWSIIRRKIHNLFKHKLYYDDKIEYFLHRCISDIRKKQFDAIIIANRPGYALSLKKHTNARIILQINNDYLNKRTKEAENIKESCNLIITCSNYLNKLVSEIPCTRIVPTITIHNGIDISKFANAKPLDRSTLGMKNDDFIVFFSGRLTKEKGILELIQATKQIKDIPNLKLIIAGASFYGKDSNITPYIRELQEESEEIKEQVFFTGFVNYNVMPSFLRTANIAVVPSIWDEPFGLTVLEAMAAGLPLIATRCGGIPEICEGTAILIERDNIIQELVDSIRLLYNNPDIAQELGKKGRKRAWLFDKEDFSKSYLETIQQALNS